MRGWVVICVSLWVATRLPPAPGNAFLSSIQRRLRPRDVEWRRTTGRRLQNHHSRWQAARVRRRATSSAPREIVDLYGMKTRELKAFLSEKGINVDDCYDVEALIDRAAATEAQWAAVPASPAPAPTRAPPPIQTPPVSPAPPPPVAPPPPPIPSAAEVEAAWKRVSSAWPGREPIESGESDANMSVILLHGFGDTGAGFLSQTFAPLTSISGLRLLLPQAPEEQLQGQTLQSWFLPSNGQWVIDDNVAQPVTSYVHAMVRREIARGVAPSRIVLGGFAQGGSCAVRAALSFPDAPLGGAIMLSSFFGAGSASVTPANRGLQVLVCHGKQDDIVPFSEGERTTGILRGLLQGGDAVSFKQYDMKHGAATDEVYDVLEFLNARMESIPQEPLAFDPIEASTLPTPAPPFADPAAAPPPQEGVPTLDPKILLELLDDPVIVEGVKDPEGMAVVQDAIMNVSTLENHRSNPRVAAIVEKLSSKLEGARSSPLVD